MQSLFTVREASTLLKISPSSIYRYCERGLIPHIKKCFGLRFRREDLEKWMEGGKREARLSECILKAGWKNDLTNWEAAVNDKVKGGQSSLAKASQTCFNYGYGSIYTRKTKSGNLRWYLYFHDENRKRVRKVVSNAQTKEEALFALKNEVLKAFSKKRGVEPRRENIGFRAFSQIYLQGYIMLTRRNFQSDVYRLKKLTDCFCDTKLRAITPLMVERFRALRLKAGNSKTTSNRYLALLKKMLNLAVEEGYLEENPVKKVKLYSEKENLKERILTEEEERRLMETSSANLKSVLSVALNTGMRLGEILSLRWDQVDLGSRRIRVENTKSGKTRTIEVNTPLLRELLELRRRDSRGPYLFFNPKTGKPLSTVKTAFKASCRRAGIEGLRFHDLRHTFASRLVKRGIDLITVKELLGHSTVKITERYTHSDEERKRKAVELLATKPKEKLKSTVYLTHRRHTERKESREEPLSEEVNSFFSVN